MPEISLLVEISEFFDVSIPEIINGERKSEIVNEEAKEVIYLDGLWFFWQSFSLFLQAKKALLLILEKLSHG